MTSTLKWLFGCGGNAEVWEVLSKWRGNESEEVWKFVNWCFDILNLVAGCFNLFMDSPFVRLLLSSWDTNIQYTNAAMEQHKAKDAFLFPKVVLVPLSPWRTCPSAGRRPRSLSAAAPWSSAASGTGWFWEAENAHRVRGRTEWTLVQLLLGGVSWSSELMEEPRWGDTFLLHR